MNFAIMFGVFVSVFWAHLSVSLFFPRKYLFLTRRLDYWAMVILDVLLLAEWHRLDISQLLGAGILQNSGMLLKKVTKIKKAKVLFRIMHGYLRYKDLQKITGFHCYLNMLYSGRFQGHRDLNLKHDIPLL